jgi:hypothetical protein
MCCVLGVRSQTGSLIRPAYALENAAEAHEDLESRKSTGKLVLSIGG